MNSGWYEVGGMLVVALIVAALMIKFDKDDF